MCGTRPVTGGPHWILKFDRESRNRWIEWFVTRLIREREREKYDRICRKHVPMLMSIENEQKFVNRMIWSLGIYLYIEMTFETLMKYTVSILLPNYYYFFWASWSEKLIGHIWLKVSWWCPGYQSYQCSCSFSQSHSCSSAGFEIKLKLLSYIFIPLWLNRFGR